VISRVYLLDTALEAGFIGAWARVLQQQRQQQAV
jgi:hypothetical protein